MIAATAVSMLPWPEIITIGSSVMLLLDGVEQLQPVEAAALQPDVEKDKARPARGHDRERVVGVARGARQIPFVLQDTGDEFPDICFVINDQDVGGHGFTRFELQACGDTLR